MPSLKGFRGCPVLAWACLVPLAFPSLWDIPAQALEPPKALTRPLQEVWPQQEEALPVNDIATRIPTRRRYIRLGTADGLVRFDSFHFLGEVP